MQNNYILTGSIASGKSSVLKIIADEGYMTISADDVVKELYKDEEFLKSFKDLIGKEYFTEGLKLDKDKMRCAIFTDTAFKEKVEAFVHHIEIKGIIFVDIDKDIQVERLMNRNNITKEEAVSRIDTRVTNDEKLKASGYIILNNSTHSDLKREVLKTLERINEKAN